MGMEVDRNRLAEDIKRTENARAVLKKRYLKKNEKGEPIEEPIDMFLRVASNIAEGEFRFKEGEEARRLYEESRERFLQIMLSRKFMPNSPTLCARRTIWSRAPWVYRAVLSRSWRYTTLRRTRSSRVGRGAGRTWAS
jgi:ribonucleotide reductase alpha subunit